MSRQIYLDTPDNSPDNSPATSSYTPSTTAHRKAKYKPQPAMGQDVRDRRHWKYRTATTPEEHGQASTIIHISSEERYSKGSCFSTRISSSNAMSGVRSLYSKSLVMQPEPLIEIPSDLVTGWISMVFPQGERCLLVSANGKTTSRGIKGHRIDTFLSCLPGGSYASVSPRQNKPCILTAYTMHQPKPITRWIFSCGTGHQFTNATRISDSIGYTPGYLRYVGRIIMANQRRIVPIQAYGCTVDELRMQLAQAESNALAAGMFLLNRQCFYSAGESTPLFCTIVFPDRLLESTAVSQSLGVLQTWLISNP
ncbi:hypothetical protein BASA83_005505 [Batrachochytrium salamandrivorans]|nr:hypothetical protein BASA83_005505 [Batrachochytrium salamandrivorans]